MKVGANPGAWKPLRVRDIETLAALRAALRLHKTLWVTPMLMGATDATHHSHTLRKLVGRKLVERRRRDTLMNVLGSSRGSYEYTITAEGRAFLDGEGGKRLREFRQRRRARNF